MNSTYRPVYKWGDYQPFNIDSGMIRTLRLNKATSVQHIHSEGVHKTGVFNMLCSPP